VLPTWIFYLRQESYELGLEMSFLNERVGFDVSYYNNQNIKNYSYSIIYFNWILSALLNAGTIENKRY
jgi:hypothetical protein